MVGSKLRSKLSQIIRRSALKLGRALFESDPLSNPLTGDRCIEYAFVVRNLVGLDRERYKSVLDVGCLASPLTTIVREIGFVVDGVDLLPSPCVYEGTNYIQADFLSADFKHSPYDVVILCSTVEHIGLEGRYGSPSIKDGDIKALEKAKQILRPAGILILTVPYGQEKTVKRLHRVYNKDGELLKYAYANFKVEIEQFYKNNSQNIWVKCEEVEAKRVAPTEYNYALGLFVFRRM